MFPGVQGYVQDNLQNPMRNATVKVQGISRVYEVTRNMAHFKIMLPPGVYKLEVNSHGYMSKTVDVRVELDNLRFIRVILDIMGTVFENNGENKEPGSVQGMASGIRGILFGR